MDPKKQKKTSKEANTGYQTIIGSKTSLDNINSLSNDRSVDSSSGIVLNAPVNLKKSKTFKLIVKKSKDKDKISFSKKEKSKTKNRKRKETVEEIKEVQRPLFGVTLKQCCANSKSHDGYPLPAFFRMILNYLEKDNRLSYEGIYRIPGVNSQVLKLKHSIQHDSDIPALLQNYDTAVIASIVKSFIRDLPNLIVDKNVEKLMFNALEENKDRIESVKSIINEKLAIENRYFLSLIIGHMSKVIDTSHLNKMTLENLLIVLSPTIKIHFELLKFMYDHSLQLFNGLQVPIYVPPIRPGPEHEEELPETVDGITEELQKQTSYLDDLHEQMSAGIQSENTEYLIWEVQLIVTRLKRKKYIVELNDPEQIRMEIKKYERQLERLRKDLTDKNSGESTVLNNIVINQNTVSIQSDIADNNQDTGSGALLPSSATDQEFWQVQRTLTTLNRKLKSLTQPTRTQSRYNSNQHSTAHSNQVCYEKGDESNYQNNPPHHQQHPSNYEELDNGGDDHNHDHFDDSDDDSVQMNLTLRKLPIETPESFENEIDKNEEEICEVIQKDQYKETESANTQEKELEKCQVELEEPIKSIKDCSIESKENENGDNKIKEILEVSDENTAHLRVDLDREPSETGVSSNGAQRTTTEDDDAISNSESYRTGSHMAACIDDLMQTGELWTNESEQLIPEDEDARNEALRLLYVKDELISIRNDLKTRLSSESNEISRLKRNIEELEEEKSRKLFHQQNQYQQLNEDDEHYQTQHHLVAALSSDDSDDDDEDDDDDDDEEDVDDGTINHQHQYNNSNDEDDDDDNGDNELSELSRRQREICDDNARLEKENQMLLEHIQIERDRCVELKVTMRSQMMMQVQTTHTNSNHMSSNMNVNESHVSPLSPSQCWP